jgi:RNA polymerase sigma-70 factor, ECF subfamily
MLFKIPGKNKIPVSEKDLIRNFNSTGDLEILGELYSGYMHLVYGVCLKYLKDREESMDAVMQIFEKLITGIPKQEIGNFRNWLHVVTKNYCLMQLRSQKSKDAKFRDWINDTSLFMENASVMHPIDENETDRDKDLTDCIERLKSEQKECIVQFYYENRCYNEISLKMGLEEKKVKSNLQNAKRNLKLCLEGKHAGQKQKYESGAV